MKKKWRLIRVNTKKVFLCTLLFVLVAVSAVSAIEGLQYAKPSIEKIVTVEVDLGKTSTFSGEIETHASGKPTLAVNHLNFIFVLKGSPGITYKGTIKVQVEWDALLEIWEPSKDSHGGGHVIVEGGFDLDDQKTWDRRDSVNESHQKKSMKGTKNLEFEFEVLGWNNEYRFGVIAVAGGEGLKGGKYDARTKVRVSGTVESEAIPVEEAITGLEDPFLEAPPDGTTVDVNEPLTGEVRIEGHGSGTVIGQWLVDGAAYQKLSATMTDGLATATVALPTGVVGTHTVQVKITAPNAVDSNVVTYNVAVPFSVSSATIVAPTDSTSVNLDETLISIAKIVGTGSGQVNDNWFIDDGLYQPLTATMTDGLAEAQLQLPTSATGSHTVRVEIISPNAVSSNTVTYHVVVPFAYKRPPRLIIPFDGAANVLSPLFFLWHRVGGAHEYHIMVALDPGFFKTIWEEKTSETLITYPVDGPALIGGKWYYWKVEALDVQGNPGRPSSAFRFSFAPDQPVTGAIMRDMAVIGLEVKPAVLKMGKESKVYVTVKNLGNIAEMVIQKYLRVFVGGQKGGQLELAIPREAITLASDEEKTIECVWMPMLAGYFPITALLTMPIDADIANNMLTIKVTVTTAEDPPVPEQEARNREYHIKIVELSFLEKE